MAFLLWWVADLEHPTTYTFGEAPKPFAACRYAGQDAILRGGCQPPLTYYRLQKISPATRSLAEEVYLLPSINQIRPSLDKPSPLPC
jgi:hypothetical protein